MRSIVLFLIAIIIATASQAQQKLYTYHATLTLEDMYSTHSNHFAGVGMAVNRQLRPWLAAGVGIAYSYAKWHGDNGWNLYKLQFVPVYMNQYFYGNNNNRYKLVPFVHLQEGISFISYYKELQDNPGPKTHVNETGFYGYAGAGAQYLVAPRVGLLLEGGIRSFHISSNVLEVNPHGITGKAGMYYKF